jgi:hypothetical protein
MQFAKFLWKILLVVLLAATSVSAQKKLTPSEAKQHVGEAATVCGTDGNKACGYYAGSSTSVRHPAHSSRSTTWKTTDSLGMGHRRREGPSGRLNARYVGQ